MAKRMMALILAAMLWVAGSGSVMAAGQADGLVDTLSKTYQLGPFEIEYKGKIVSATETEFSTELNQYSLISLEGKGVTDELIATNGIENVSRAAAEMVAAGIKEQGDDAHTYLNKNGIYCVYYPMEIGSSCVLCLMLVHGKELMMTTQSAGNTSDFDGSFTVNDYAEYLLDKFTLADEKTGILTAGIPELSEDTYVLGSHRFNYKGTVISQTEESVSTSKGQYDFVSLEENIGITEEDVISASVALSNYSVLSYFKDYLIKEDGGEGEIYFDEREIMCAYYVKENESVRVLKILLVHGVDCLMVQELLGEDEEVDDAYIRSRMQGFELTEEALEKY